MSGVGGGCGPGPAGRQAGLAYDECSRRLEKKRNFAGAAGPRPGARPPLRPQPRPVRPAHPQTKQITAEGEFAPLCTFLETLLTMAWWVGRLGRGGGGWEGLGRGSEQLDSDPTIPPSLLALLTNLPPPNPTPKGANPHLPSRRHETPHCPPIQIPPLSLQCQPPMKSLPSPPPNPTPPKGTPPPSPPSAAARATPWRRRSRRASTAARPARCCPRGCTTLGSGGGFDGGLRALVLLRRLPCWLLVSTACLAACLADFAAGFPAVCLALF